LSPGARVPFLVTTTGRIEYQGIHTPHAKGPPLVLLHEGLGSLSMWKDFPRKLAQATRRHVVMYSRHGYGRSERLRAPRGVRYMHTEALVVLPEVLDRLGLERPILFGHSDGGSIALIYAGENERPLAGVIALAPHVFVEDLSVESIAASKKAYQRGALRKRLSRYHQDVDGAFWGWNDIWLHPAFRAWSIGEYLPRIVSPVLAIQGEQDEYGTMEQIELIARAASDVEVLKIKACGHSPHRDQPDLVLDAVTRWTEKLRRTEIPTRQPLARAGERV
jgi:pimeloyl-ACP methyl ester carboxylesterase